MLKIPLSFCQKFKVVLANMPNDLVLQYVEQPNYKVLSEVQRITTIDYKTKQISQQEFDEQISAIYEDSSDIAQIALDDIDEEESLETIAESLHNTQDLLSSNDDAPIARLINLIISQAVRQSASDIHIEVYEKRMRIRFRIDGVLREILQPDDALSSRIIARIKVMAKMDIAEKQLPQDGRISTKMGNKNIDIRVSSISSSRSEKIVLRLLEKQLSKLNLVNLGMPDNILKQFNESIHKSQGILLVTGPTGSGKTTTLYAALNKLNSFETNIMTVEDPIEYHIDGINQTMVNNKLNITFSKSLRSILRQDPDIIMIGEIRDKETAEIAIQSSLTGHLVFSTLHTNTAVGAISRLRDMGVEEFLLASSLSGVLAQRLLRVLCKHCKEPQNISKLEWESYFYTPYDENITIYKEKGCGKCGNSGYTGRTGVYEFVIMDNTLKEMIHNKASDTKMSEYSASKYQTIQNSSTKLILQGITSINETIRVNS